MLSTKTTADVSATELPANKRYKPASSLSVFAATQGALNRPVLEQQVAGGFRAAFGAEITEFMPLLVGVGNTTPLAVAGIRTGQSPFFVETYLKDSLQVFELFLSQDTRHLLQYMMHPLKIEYLHLLL